VELTEEGQCLPGPSCTRSTLPDTSLSVAVLHLFFFFPGHQTSSGVPTPHAALCTPAELALTEGIETELKELLGDREGEGGSIPWRFEEEGGARGRGGGGRRHPGQQHGLHQTCMHVALLQASFSFLPKAIPCGSRIYAVVLSCRPLQQLGSWFSPSIRRIRVPFTVLPQLCCAARGRPRWGRRCPGRCLLGPADPGPGPGTPDDPQFSEEGLALFRVQGVPGSASSCASGSRS